LSKNLEPKAKRSKLKLLVIQAAFFLFLVFYALYVPFPSEKEPIRFYSSHTRDDLYWITVKAIRSAKRSLHIYTYALTDPSVLSLLMQKAKEGLAVHVTYHEKNTPRLKKLPHLYLHPKAEKGLMHAKWIVADETFILIGTANLTTSSLKMHDNLLIGIYDPSFAKALISPQTYQGVIGTQNLSFYFLPHRDGLSHLLSHLEKTEKKLFAALFTFTHPKLSQTLLDLHQKGVNVTLALDQTSSRGASKQTFQALKEGGVPICTNQGLPLLHHKWALLDESTLLLGSANWTRAAFEKNRDYLLSLSPLTKKQKRFFQKMIKQIEKESAF